MTPTEAEYGRAFRKKPVVIEAVQFTKAMAEGHDALPAGVIFSARNLDASGHFPEYANDGKYLTNYSTCHRHYIQTLEGRMDVQIGDWIIRGVKGEFYPCKPDIFDATYEPADPRAAELAASRKPGAVEGLVAKWRTEAPNRDEQYGDREATMLASVMLRCADELESALATESRRDSLAVDVFSQIRQAVADYMYSEGCTCCQDIEAHEKHAERLAELLDVPPYEDGSAYDFRQFSTAAIDANGKGE